MKQKGLFKNKKGIELWLSWVILVAFTISMGALLTTWMFEYTDRTSTSIKKIVYNEADCNDVSFVIENFENTTSSIDINVSNKGKRNIDAVIFRIYKNQDGTEVENIRYNMTDESITFKPGRTRRVSLTEYTGNIYILDGIPILYKEDMEIICQNKISTKES